MVPLHFSVTRRDLSSQINIQIPSDLEDGPHTVRVHRLNLDGTVESTSAAFRIQVRGASPTYFGTDLLPVLIQNLTQNPAGRVFVSGNTPAAPGGCRSDLCHWFWRDDAGVADRGSAATWCHGPCIAAYRCSGTHRRIAVDGRVPWRCSQSTVSRCLSARISVSSWLYPDRRNRGSYCRSRR